MIKLNLGIKLDTPVEVTDEQYDAMIKLIKRYGKEPEERWKEWGFGALMCEFDGLIIGIEKDGLAHS